jgi:hypothetical protein
MVFAVPSSGKAIFTQNLRHTLPHAVEFTIRKESVALGL